MKAAVLIALRLYHVRELDGFVRHQGDREKSHGAKDPFYERQIVMHRLFLKALDEEVPVSGDS